MSSVLNSSIARSTVRTSFVLLLRLAVQAGTLLVVARMLGPQQFGVFVGFASLAMILGTLSSFGSHIVLLGEVSKEPERRGRVLAYAIPITVLFGCVLFIVFLSLSFLMLSETSMLMSFLIAIGVTEIILQPLLSLVVMEYLASGRAAGSQMLATLPLVLRLLAAVVVFLIGPTETLTWYALAYFGVSLFALLAAIATLPLPWPSPAEWRIPQKKELRAASGYAVISLSKTAPGEFDKTLAMNLLPLSSAGLYAAGARVVGATTLPVIAMMLSALPKLFRGHNSEHSEVRFFYLMFLVAFSYGIILAFVLWLSAPVFDSIFGLQYEGIGEMVCWLSLAAPGMALRIVAGNVLMATGNSWVRVGFEAVGLSVLTLSAVVFTPKMGPPGVGMALALVSSEWSMALLGAGLVTLRKKKGL